MDVEIINRVLAGDTEAFAQIVERYGDMVYRLVSRTLGDGDRARDVTQDVFIKVYRSLGKWRGGSAFATWLYRVACNAAISHIRGERRHEPVDERRMGVADDGEEVLRKAADERRYADLERALGRLAADERAMVTMFYTDGMSVEGIGVAMGLTVANVKVRLHRVRKKIAYFMGDENG